MLDIPFLDACDLSGALRSPLAPGDGLSISLAGFVPVHENMPLDSQMIGQLGKWHKTALRELDTLDSLRAEIEAADSSDLRKNPILRLALYQQPASGKHGRRPS